MTVLRVRVRVRGRVTHVWNYNRYFLPAIFNGQTILNYRVLLI
jgi:hypothetical protein